MNIYTGNHAQIGEQIGNYYKTQGTKLNNIKINHKLLSDQVKIYQKYYPQKLEQLKKIAQAANFDIDEFIYQNICSFIDWHRSMNEPQKGCTIFGIENDSGVFVGRNYDWKPGTENYFKVIKSINSDAINYIGITDMNYFQKSDGESKHLFYDIDDAINENGLYIGLTFAYHDSVGIGLSPIHMNQLIAETCTTVDQALLVFSKIPLAVPKNFFISDASGKMAVIEHTSQKYKQIYPVNEILIQTNHYLDNELAMEDTVLKHNELSSTYKRYSEALEILTVNKQHVHQIGLEKILKNPNLDILENTKRMKTIWSLSMDMKKRNYRLYWNMFDGLKEERLDF